MLCGKRFLAGLTVSFCLLGSLVQAATYYVSAADGNNVWDGLAQVWDGNHGPKQTIQAAIDVSTDPADVVQVEAGTYPENLNYHGKALVVRSANPSDFSMVQSTIIKGGTGGSCAEFESGEGPDSVLEGFTLLAGYGGSATAELVGYGLYTFSHTGGGVLCENSSPTVRRCIIRRGPQPYNQKNESGGGIAVIGASQGRFESCFIVENLAYNGGGVFVYGFPADSCIPVFDHCTIAMNYSINTVYLKDSVQKRNYAFDCRLAEPTITNCIFDNPTNYSSGNMMGDLLLRNPAKVLNCCVNNCALFLDNLFTGTNIQPYDLTVSGGNINEYPGFVLTGEIRPEYIGGMYMEFVAQAGDYHLRLDSPCRDAGDPNFDILADEDIDGHPRIMGGRTDMGADEVVPVIILERPQTGDVWAAGSSHEVRWKNYSFDGTVDISFSDNNGVSWSVLAEDLLNTGNFLWSLPGDVNSSQCLVRVEASEPPPLIDYIGMDGLFTIHPSPAGEAFASDWPTLAGSSRRAGLSPFIGPEVGCIAWQFDAPEPLTGGVVFGADGRLHVCGEKGTLYTLDGGGQALWSFACETDLVTAPTVGPDGTLYVGGWNGKLYAIDKDGQLRWTHQTEGSMWSSAAVGADGTVFAASAEGKVYALAPDGSELWSFTVEANGRIPGAIIAPVAVGLDGSVYAGAATQPILYALDPADGEFLWKTNLAHLKDPNLPGGPWILGKFASTPVVGADGTIYAALVGDTNLYALNPADGQVNWALDLGDPNSGLFGGSYVRQTYKCSWTEPALGPDGTIYVSFGNQDAYLRSAHPDGEINWARRLGALGEFSLTVGSNGNIYAAGADGSVYILNPAGAMLSRFDGAQSLSFPVVGPAGILYVIDGAQKLYAIRLDGCPASVRNLHRLADHNGDGAVNLLDLAVLRRYWLLNTAPYDPAIWPVKADWSATHISSQMYLPGDFNHDLIVDINDLLLLRAKWLSME